MTDGLRELTIPSRPWPAGFPSVTWGGWRLTPQSSAPRLDLSSGDFGQALRFCYPELGLSALAALVDQTGQAESILLAYGLRPSERLTAVLKILIQTPEEFRAWVDLKRLAARDLFPLVALPDLFSFGPFLRKLSSSSLSKSEGAQALEWAVEIAMMEEESSGPRREKICGSKESPRTDENSADKNSDVQRLNLLPDKNWFTELRRQRRPIETADLESRQSALREWPLPAQTSAQWQSGSDEVKLELRLQAKSPRDLTNKLKALGAVSNAWEDWEKL